jgi:hypothetical protein
VVRFVVRLVERFVVCFVVRLVAGGAAGVAAGVLALVPAPARAGPCGQPYLVDTVPPDGAGGVPVNAALSARYESTARHQGEVVMLGRKGEPASPVAATFDSTEHTLTVIPPAAFEPGTSYVVRWPDLLGGAAAGAQGERAVTFTTGRVADAEAPTFEGLAGIRWDVERRRSDCTDSLLERYVFDLDLGAVADDGGRESLTLIVLHTEGPLVKGARVPVLTRTIPARGTSARVSLIRDEGVGHVCFAAIARDLTGQVSGGGEREVCVDTIAPPFFRGGCSFAGLGRAGGSPPGDVGVWAAIGWLLASLVFRRARRARGFHSE